MISASQNDFGPLFASGDEDTKDNVTVAQATPGLDEPDWASEAAASVHEFAKLDGYDVRLLGSDEGIRRTGTESKCWRVPVRIFKPDPTWRSLDGRLEGSHDEDGEVRPEFLADLSLYNEDGTARKELLDRDCLEYNDFILMAGRYKPFKLPGNVYEPPEEIIRALQTLEARIQDGLANLLAMVEEGNEHI